MYWVPNGPRHTNPASLPPSLPTCLPACLCCLISLVLYMSFIVSIDQTVSTCRQTRCRVIATLYHGQRAAWKQNVMLSVESHLLFNCNFARYTLLLQFIFLIYLFKRMTIPQITKNKNVDTLNAVCEATSLRLHRHLIRWFTQLTRVR